MLARIMREGFLAGLIGAAAVAVWFLLIDVLAGQPFYTPAMLGSAVFWGLRDPALVEITFPAVIGYSLLHVVAFSLAGMVAAALAAMVDKLLTVHGLAQRMHSQFFTNVGVHCPEVVSHTQRGNEIGNGHIRPCQGAQKGLRH